MGGLLGLLIGALIGIIFYTILRSLLSRRLLLERRIHSIEMIGEEDTGTEDEVLRLPLIERTLYPVLKALGRRIQSFAPTALKGSLAGRLVQAGNRMSAEQYMGWYLFAAGIGLAAGAGLGLMAGRPSPLVVLLAVVMGAMGAFLPELLLRQHVRRRQQEISRALPDVLDLLTVSVKAGLGFDSALRKVTEKMKGALPDELQKVLHEIRMGVPRHEALRSMSERTGVESLKAFVSTIIQADQLGVSITNVLSLQSESLRDKRRQIAEEAAMKAPVKMLFPMILFIFPTIFIVLLGPVVLQLINNF
ncbi:MAG TPA: type II secretion system F family protein [Bacillota bacterium]|nr:type II secretion system F family protein [Bacillota bacterium]